MAETTISNNIKLGFSKNSKTSNQIKDYQLFFSNVNSNTAPDIFVNGVRINQIDNNQSYAEAISSINNNKMNSSLNEENPLLKINIVGSFNGSTSPSSLYLGSPYFQYGELYSSSDARLKEDIKGIDEDFVNKLFERSDITYDFKWKNSQKTTSGFIAQNIEDIMPEAIEFDENKDEYSVNYNAALSKVVGALFKKIKEQDKLIQTLYDNLEQKENS